MKNIFQHKEDEDDSSEWDSDDELKVAKVKEATRIQRKIPSIQRNMSQASRKSSTFVRPVSTTRTGPLYYCQEIGPQLDLGYQWPQQQPMKAVQGFVKVSAANTHTRQKQIERKMLAKRQKVRRSV